MTMKNGVRIAIALVASAASPAIILVATAVILDVAIIQPGNLKSLVTIWVVAFIVALLHAIFLGLPAYFLLRRLNLVRWWTSLLCGFVIGCLPWSIISFPHASPGSGYEADGVNYIVNGAVTQAGWVSYIDSVCVWLAVMGSLQGSWLGSSGGIVIRTRPLIKAVTCRHETLHPCPIKSGVSRPGALAKTWGAKFCSAPRRMAALKNFLYQSIK